MTDPVKESINSTEQSTEAPPVSDLNNLIAGCVVNFVFSFTAFTGNGLVLATILENTIFTLAFARPSLWTRLV